MTTKAAAAVPTTAPMIIPFPPSSLSFPAGATSMGLSMPGVSLGEGGLALGATAPSLGESLGAPPFVGMTLSKGAAGAYEDGVAGLVLSAREVGIRVTGNRVRTMGFLVGNKIGALLAVSGA